MPLAQDGPMLRRALAILAVATVGEAGRRVRANKGLQATPNLTPLKAIAISLRLSSHSLPGLLHAHRFRTSSSDVLVRAVVAGCGVQHRVQRMVRSEALPAPRCRQHLCLLCHGAAWVPVLA